MADTNISRSTLCRLV